MRRPEARLRSLDPDVGRFARHRLIEGWDQDRLRAARLAVFGVGALGNEVAKNLALLGIGTLLLVDMDRVEVSNLSRAVLFRMEDCGRPKAEAAAQRLRELAPETSVEAITGDLHLTIGPGLLERFDAAIGCLDSVEARLGLDRLCRRAGLSWWNGGLGAAACEITRFAPDAGPCYACTLSQRALHRELTRWSCQDGRRRELPPRTLPTTATSAALGGALLVQDAVSALMPSWAEHALPPGTRLLLAATPYSLVRFDVPRSPRCPFHEGAGEAPERLVRLGLDHRASGRALIAELAIAPPSEVEVHLGLDLVVSWSCRCGPAHAPFLPARAAPDRCPACGALPENLTTKASLPGSHPALDLPLSRLGIANGGEVTLHDGRQATTVRLAPLGLEFPS